MTSRSPLRFAGGAMPETFVYGIGAQKAGTTWLFAQLDRHPDVFLRAKELHYWDSIRSPFFEEFALHAKLRAPIKRRLLSKPRLRELHDPTARQKRRRALALRTMYEAYDASHQTYVDFLSDGRAGQKVVGDITPSYALVSRQALAEMATIHPNARFIFIMRDPVDRLWSGLRHRYRPLIKAGHVSEERLLSAVEEALENPADQDMHRSDYAAALDKLDAALPADRVHYLFYETLFEPEAYDSVLEFLGLPAQAADFAERVNVGEGGGMQLPERLRNLARAALSDSYERVANRFADRVPAQWGMAE